MMSLALPPRMASLPSSPKRMSGAWVASSWFGNGPDQIVTRATKDRVGRHIAAAQRIIPILAKDDVARRIVPGDEIVAGAAEETVSFPAMPPTVSLPSSPKTRHRPHNQ